MGSDWAIVGGGLTGVSLAYELAKRQQSVVLLEQHDPIQGATRWSYGGVAYWSGTTPWLQQLCQESRDRYAALAQELALDIEYRDTHLLIPIEAEQDLAAVCQEYQSFTPAPDLLTPQEAQDIEPLLNPSPFQAALRFPHGHVNPLALVRAYRQGFVALGGTIVQTRVTGWQTTAQQRISGIETTGNPILSDRVILSAGAGGRSLLNQLGVSIPLYFNQAELIETEATDLPLNGVVLPANQSRLRLESTLTDPAFAEIWHQGKPLNLPPALEPGGVQFQDGRCCLGQISRFCRPQDPAVDRVASEALMREAIAKILPDLATLPGTWRHCRVSFSADGLPLIGALPPWENLFLFSGFTSPFALVPALAVRFAQGLVGELEPELEIFAPTRSTTHSTPKPSPEHCP
ncbi:MAG: hypothetical protein RLZZ435_86 [Cyanobacteriota bacterium]